MSEVRANFNPKGPLPPGYASTAAWGEEADDYKHITMRVGEAGELTMTPSGTEGGEFTMRAGEGGFSTTQAVGEDGNRRWYTTHAVGEEGYDNTTKAVGEEGDDYKFSTMRVGEEGDDPGVPSGPILLDPINTQYNRLLELLKKILQRLINNKGIGIGFPPIINPNPPIDYYPNPIVGRDYTNSMPQIINTASARIEHAYLPEAE
jgi:hypothetical protein